MLQNSALGERGRTLKRRGSWAIWFEPAMTWDASPTGKRGRRRGYRDSAIRSRLTVKVLFGYIPSG